VVNFFRPQVYLDMIVGPLKIPNIPSIPQREKSNVVPTPSACATLGEMRAVNSVRRPPHSVAQAHSASPDASDSRRPRKRRREESPEAARLSAGWRLARVQFGLLGWQEGERHPVLMFKNVPYAQPVERFQPALPWASPPWEGIRDATESGPPCFQMNWDRSNGNNRRVYRGVEDCLTMDVVVPTYAYDAAVASQTVDDCGTTTTTAADTAPIPIVVVIHDGNLEEVSCT